MTLYFCMLLLKARQNHIKVISTNILCSESNGSQGWFPLQVKLQDGFTVLLMTETKFGTILTLENNTNPFELLGNCRSCQENWMNRGHEKTRLCLEHENKITFYLLFHCS